MIFSTKLRDMMDKYKLSYKIKVVIFLIILFIIARLFIPSIQEKSNSIINIEGFEALGYSNYGNQLSLQDPINTPKYSGNTAIFKLDGVYRIEALKFIFNNNTNKSTIPEKSDVFNPSNISKIYIQYEDGNGNMRYIRSSIAGTPPNFANTNDLTTETITNKSNELNQLSTIYINNITDENNLAVYTSKIIVIVGNANNRIDRYVDIDGNGYISNFALWGTTRDMLSRNDFENLAPTLSSKIFAFNGTTFDDKTNADTYTYTITTDMVLYGLNVEYDKSIFLISNTPSTTKPNGFNTTDSPFKLSILYNNGIYSGNNFTINNKYIIRTDLNVIETNNLQEYIIFNQPIIANKLIITIPRVKKIISGEIIQCVLKRIKGYGKDPTQNDINTYQKDINALLSAANKTQTLDVCPSVDNLIMKQNQAQQICDNLEYQDKIKSEKLRLEKNKQYLLKLKQQQEQIDQLNALISTIDEKRQSRAKTNDVARVMQYQNQKEIASKILDMANQREQLQNNNNLNIDLRINP
jgi:hypothetical protein